MTLNNTINKKEIHIFLWEKYNDNCTNTTEYVYEKIPSIQDIKDIIKDKNICIAIGENPSMANGIIGDETNMYLKNKLYSEKQKDGYILLNLFSIMETNFTISLQKLEDEYLERINTLLDAFENLDVILFYGPNVINKLRSYKTIKEKKPNLFKFFNILENRDNVYYTGFKNFFAHPACRGVKGAWSIFKLTDTDTKIEWRIIDKSTQKE